MKQELFFDYVSPLYSFGYQIEIFKPRGKSKDFWRVTKDGVQVFLGTYDEYRVFFSKTIDYCLEHLLEPA